MATDSIYVTRAGAYAETVPPDALRSTRAAAYIEIQRASAVRSTSAAAYAELISVIESGVTTLYAHPYSPYGIMVSATYKGGDNRHLGFVWQWSTDGVTDWATFATTDKTTLYARHHPLPPSTQYYYRAYPYRYSAGDFSNVANATTLAVHANASGVALWIDVYAGESRIGPGPLVEITSWRTVHRLNRAGEFSAEFPATYLRLHEAHSDSDPLLHTDRYLFCYGIIDDAVTLIGAGIVKEIQLSRNAGAPPMIVASGPDLLGELRRVTVYDDTGRPWQYTLDDVADAPDQLVIDFATSAHLPDDWTITNGGATATNVTAKFVHSTLLSALIDIAAKIGEYFRLGSGNNGREIEWLGLPSTFAAAAMRAELSVDPVAAESNPDICLITTIEEIQDSWDLYTNVFVFGAGQGHDRLDLSAVTHWPDGDRMRSTIASITGSGTTVTVVTNEAHGLHFAEAVYVEGTNNFDAGYSVNGIISSTTFTFASAITATESTGWVYGSNGHVFANGVSLVLDRNQSSIEHLNARTDYGYHYTAVQFKEIAPLSNADGDVSTAANALLAAAYNWLLLHAAPAKFYRLAVAKCDALLLPGQVIRVVARGFVDNKAYININRDLTILEVTNETGRGGIRTTGLVVATVERWPSGDGEQAAAEFHQASIYQSQAQLGPNVDTTSYNSAIDDDNSATFYFWLAEEVVGVNQVILRLRSDALRSTVKSIGGSSATTDSGGGATPTSSSGGGSSPTTTSYAPVTNHAHGLEITDLTPTGAPLYYDSSAGLNANLGTGDEVGGSTNLVSVPLTHDHDVTIDPHTHNVTIDPHTHDVTAAITTAYGVYEDPGTHYAFSNIDFEIAINGGAWHIDYSAISGASGWYELDLTAEVVGPGLRPLQKVNGVEIRVRSSLAVGNKAQITAQIERRVVIQSIAQF